MFAASAIAANTVARSAAGAAAPLFTDYMFSALGVGGGGSLIAGVGCLLAPAPFLFYKYGRSIRERSKFAPTQEKKPEDEKKEEEEETSAERSHSATSNEEEIELGEEAGVADSSDLEKEIEKGHSHRRSSSQSPNDDRFLDASGMERAEGA